MPRFIIWVPSNLFNSPCSPLLAFSKENIFAPKAGEQKTVEK
jgi:hypothetical protein